MQLHQIQVKYVALEDRALLRIATKPSAEARSEFRFWVTRRYAIVLLAALGKNVVRAASTQPETPAETRSAMLEFQRESALARADFKTGYAAADKTTPLGEQPVLLARVGLRRLEQGISVLALHPESGKGIEIRLDDTLIHSMIKLVEDAARSAQWGLAETLPASTLPKGERLN